MNRPISKIGFSAVILLAALGAGCAPTPVAQAPAKPPVQQEVPVQPAPSPLPPPADPYEGWKEIQPGGVISLRIPPNCDAEPGAGNIYVVCPTTPGDTPPPDMHISSDGMQVNIRRWEDLAWPEWDKVIASLRVLPHLDRDIQINIQK